MQTEKFSKRLTKLTFSLNNFIVNLVASIGSDGIFLVDAGWDITAEKLKRLKESK